MKQSMNIRIIISGEITVSILFRMGYFKVYFLFISLLYLADFLFHNELEANKKSELISLYKSSYTLLS